MHRIPLSVLGLHQVAVPCFLQRQLLMVPGSKDGISLPRLPFPVIWAVHFIWPPYISGPLNRLSMPFSRSGIRAEQIVPAVALENMGPLQKDSVSAVNVPHRPGHPLFGCVKFLKHQSSHVLFGDSVIRHHADHVFASVLIVEKRRVKAKIVQRHRL